jgi:hypothetical protein
MNENFRTVLKYLGVTVGFIFTIILLVIIVDKLILPALIHDKDNVTVPNLQNKTLAEAEQLIIQNKLSLAKVNEQYNEKSPAGTVLSQVPKAGSEVKSGRSIYLSVSKGMELVTVPYVVGMPYRTARVTLKNRGIEVGTVTYQNSENLGSDTVISQLTPSGKSIPYGNSIDLVVSKGSEAQVKIPNLIGKRIDDVQKILQESGLQLGSVNTVRHETYLSNTVVNQSPEAGEIASKGTVVNILISK